MVSYYELFSKSYFDCSSDGAPPKMHLMYAELFIGGVGSRFTITPGGTGSKKPFVGCLGDAILNGAIINFSNATDEQNRKLRKCSKDTGLGAAAISQAQGF